MGCWSSLGFFVHGLWLFDSTPPGPLGLGFLGLHGCCSSFFFPPSSLFGITSRRLVCFASEPASNAVELFWLVCASSFCNERADDANFFYLSRKFYFVIALLATTLRDTAKTAQYFTRLCPHQVGSHAHFLQPSWGAKGQMQEEGRNTISDRLCDVGQRKRTEEYVWSMVFSLKQCCKNKPQFTKWTK